MQLVASLYKFVQLDNLVDLQLAIKDFCLEHEIKGTILLAPEGINGTIAGEEAQLREVLRYLRGMSPFADLTHKESMASEPPFYRMKVRIKKEIVTFGVPSVDPTNLVGTYVDSSDWNALIKARDVVVIDTRNDYEVAIGTFEGALNPNLRTFRDFPEWLEQNLDAAEKPKVAMFCTGGIRCEKATSYLLEKGFDEVYHLEGGILKYLESIPESQSLWKGQCFVFDQRISVGHGLTQGDYDLCYACGFPVDRDDKSSPFFQVGVCCARCHHVYTEEKKEHFAERQRQIELAIERNEQHIGVAQRHQQKQ
jgi:UPF0176 protein